MLRQLLLLLFLLHGTFTYSQKLLLDTYTPANGLIDARLNTTFQDSRGKMYFLTLDGFSIYDGQRFDNYSTVQGISVGIANAIIENNDHSITIYSFSGNMFVIRDNQITIDSSRRKQFLEINKVIKIGTDDYLFLTNFHIYRGGKKKLTELKINVPNTKDIYIEAAAVSGPYLVFYNWNFFWSNQMTLYNYETQEVLDVMDKTNITSLRGDTKGNIYYQDKEWFQLNPTALKNGKLVGETPWFISLLPANYRFENIDFDTGDNLWLLNSEGCLRINTISNEQARYRTIDGINTGIVGVFQDSEKNYWFSTMSRGVQKLQQSRLNKFLESDGRTVEAVGNIQQTFDKLCFAATRYGSFLLTSNKALSVTDNYNSFAYWQGQYWWMKDYRTLSGSNGTSLDIGTTLPGYSLSDFQVGSRTSIDHHGRLLIPGKTMIVIDSSFHITAMRLPYFTDDIVVDMQNNYWCFMRNNEVIQFSWDKGQLKQMSSQVIEKLNPRNAIEWNTDSFFVASRNDGILLMKKENGKFEIKSRIDKDDGLSNNFVYVLLRISDNELMAGTATGLDIIRFLDNDTVVERISARNNVFSPFDELVMDKNSIIYAKSEDDLLYVYENNRQTNTAFTPSVEFHAITVNGTPVDYSKEQHFSYTLNNFIFSVSAPSFLDNRNIIYDFLLTSGRKKWEQHNTTADFIINNLEPGHYLLTATVSFPGKVYENKKVSWRFTIAPPFWKTWWFILLESVILISIIVLTVRSYIRKEFQKQRVMLEKQQAIEKERTRIATDMHDDFGASLSRIKFLSEKLQLQGGDTRKMNEDLGKISAFSDEMAEKMGEIVWALNQRYDSSGDLVSFCRSYASEYLADKSIRLQFSTGKMHDIQINGEIRRNIFLVMKESLHNIVKHSGATEVDIDMRCDKELRVVIRDNGRGFDSQSIRPFANGLDNMKKRIEEIGGQFSIENNNGTIVTIVVASGILQNAYT